MKEGLIAALVAVALVVPSNVEAHTVFRRDSNDTDGKLDIKRISVGHGSMVLKFVFWNTLKKRYFHNQGSAGWLIDDRGDAGQDHAVIAETSPRENQPGQRLLCFIWNTRTVKIIGQVRASIDGSKLVCRVPDRIIARMVRTMNGYSSFRGHGDNTPVVNH